MSETVTAVQPDKTAMEKINLYTRRAYKPEEVYTFSVVLCDNEVDRDGECFTKETLEELAKLFVGKTGILDHEPTSKNQTARVFDAAVKEIPGKVTSLNEPYAQLTARAYVPRNDGTKAFIESIESGIRKEVSVGCAVKKRVCSVCGAESCVHVPGKTYNGKRCVRILSGAADAYEFSFVAVPAQVNAGVTKRFALREKQESTDKSYELALAREAFEKDVLRLSYFCKPFMSAKRVKELAELMTVTELIDFRGRLEKQAAENEEVYKAERESFITGDYKM